MANRWGNDEDSDRLYFYFAPKSLDGDCSLEIKGRLLLGIKAMTNLDSVLKSRNITLPTKSLYQSYGFSSSHVWMWELDCEESWVLKNWCFLTVVLEKTLESPLDCKEIKPVNPKANQLWIFIGRTDAKAEAEAPILRPLDAKTQLIRRDLILRRLESRRKRGDRGRDGWMASLTQWIWIWASSGR